jgi:hypothetical protein
LSTNPITPGEKYFFQVVKRVNKSVSAIITAQEYKTVIGLYRKDGQHWEKPSPCEAKRSSYADLRAAIIQPIKKRRRNWHEWEPGPANGH